MLRGNWVPPTLKDKHKDLEAELSGNIYYLMRHMGWGLRETLEIPIPTYFELVKCIDKEMKETKRAQKWHR